MTTITCRTLHFGLCWLDQVTQHCLSKVCKFEGVFIWNDTDLTWPTALQACINKAGNIRNVFSAEVADRSLLWSVLWWGGSLVSVLGYTKLSPGFPKLQFATPVYKWGSKNSFSKTLQITARKIALKCTLQEQEHYESSKSKENVAPQWHYQEQAISLKWQKDKK